MSKRVFFSFHYQDVIDFRANVVRNHNIVKGQSSGYFDASIWEDAKKESDLALKRLINSELKNTSVTTVLIGTETYNRRWVRYEIVRSMWKGNKLIGVHINGIKGKDRKNKVNGYNPFDYLGIHYNENGTYLQLYEWKNGNWTKYLDHDGWKINQVSKDLRGKFFQLSCFYDVYDWIMDVGYDNFETWVQ